MATPQRGPLARLYNSVVGGALRWLRAPSGEAGMARMIGPFGYGSWSTPQLSREQQVQHFRGWVYTCVDFIATQLSREPPTAVLVADPEEKARHDFARKSFVLGQGPKPEQRQWVSKAWIKKAQGVHRPNEEYEFLPSDDWLVRLLQDPNDPDTGVSVWYEWAMYLELTGTSYLWVVNNGAGRPSELWVIPSHWVREVCTGTDKLVDYYEVSPRGSTAGLTRFDPEEIIPLRRPSPLSKLAGYSPLQAAATTVDAYELTEASRIHGLRNGASVGGVIKVPGILDDDTLSRMEARFAQKFSGVHQTGRPIILEGGLDYIPQPADRELAYMSTLDQLRKYIQAHWRLSEAALGFTADSNRASMVAAIASAMYHVINPRQRAAAAILTERLAKLRDPRAKVFWPDCTPSDVDAERADWQLMVGAKAVSTNDIRGHFGLEPLEGEEYEKPQQEGGKGGPEGGGPEDAMAAMMGGGKDDEEQPTPADEPGKGQGGAMAAMMAGMAQDSDTGEEQSNKGVQTKQLHRYSCVMLPLSGAVADRLIAMGNQIPDVDLDEDGRETEPHVTVRFGLHTDDADDVIPLMSQFGPVMLKLGAVSVFRGVDSGKDYDVIKVDVESPELRDMNRRLGELPHTDTHSEYRPHATIAYVKAGLGEKWAAKLGALNTTTVADRVIFSDLKKRHTIIPLSSLFANKGYDPDEVDAAAELVLAELSGLTLK